MCVVWEDGRGDDGEMLGTFGELWESKEWKKSPCASFWLADCNGGWAFFTRVKK